MLTIQMVYNKPYLYIADGNKPHLYIADRL